MHILKPKIDRYGYKVVTISFMENNHQVRKYVPVHKLIFDAFYGIVPKGYSIDHINRDRLDNNLSNLRLLTTYDNSNKYRSTSLIYYVYDFNDKSINSYYWDDLRNKYNISHDKAYSMFRTLDKEKKVLRKSNVNIIIGKSVEDINDTLNSICDSL